MLAPPESNRNSRWRSLAATADPYLDSTIFLRATWPFISSRAK